MLSRTPVQVLDAHLVAIWTLMIFILFFSVFHLTEIRITKLEVLKLQIYFPSFCHFGFRRWFKRMNWTRAEFVVCDPRLCSTIHRYHFIYIVFGPDGERSISMLDAEPRETSWEGIIYIFRYSGLWQINLEYLNFLIFFLSFVFLIKDRTIELNSSPFGGFKVN